ncbi:MAG: CPBP family glutamic-type intramembrane protease [Bacillota bacterium]
MHARYFKKPVMFFNILLPGIVFGCVYVVANNMLGPIAVHLILNVSMTLLFKYN